jgi:hypothetical protein
MTRILSSGLLGSILDRALRGWGPGYGAIYALFEDRPQLWLPQERVTVGIDGIASRFGVQDEHPNYLIPPSRSLDAIWALEASEFRFRYRCTAHSDCREDLGLSLACQGQAESILTWFRESLPLDPAYHLSCATEDWGELPWELRKYVPRTVLSSVYPPAGFGVALARVLWLKPDNPYVFPTYAYLLPVR